MRWHMDDWTWTGWLTMTLVMVAFAGLLAWAVVVAVRSARPSPPVRDPERILAERFAAGEMDDDEYRRRLDTLRGARAS